MNFSALPTQRFSSSDHAVLGEAEFLARLQAHAGIVRKIVASYASDPSERSDLAQDIRLQLWRAWPTYRADRPFPTWMYRVALNVAISHLRRVSRDAPTVPFDPELDHLPDPLSDPADEAARERLELLQRLIAELPALDRALVLLYLDDHSHRDTAQILGLSEANVATRLSRLKQRIRQQLMRLQGDVT
jgi:RNA polymerase sigma-70 factor (ECF subfamily)